MIYDALIIGGGVSGMQCALVLGSALKKPYAEGRKVGIILHQRSSHLQNALFKNVLGLEAGTKGTAILELGINQIKGLYPDVSLIEKEKVLTIQKEKDLYIISTNKCNYKTKIAVVALNYSKPFTIKGLEDYIIPHKKANPSKDRIQLENSDHLVKGGLYVCGTLAGWRSQYSIAAGSGASVATDILTLWNDGNHAKIHDKI